MNKHDTQSDGWKIGLPWNEALIVTTALAVGLTLMRIVMGTPSGVGDWILMISTAIISPLIAYFALQRAWWLLALSLFMFLNGLWSASM